MTQCDCVSCNMFIFSPLTFYLILLRPYDDVIANNDIRRLRAQVRVEHCKVLKGRAKRVTDMGYYDMFEEADDVQDDIHIHTSGERIGRLCDQVPRRKGGGSVITVSKEKLLEASLLSLQTLGRQHQAFDGSASLDTGMGPRADNMETGTKSHYLFYLFSFCLLLSISWFC